MPPMPEIAADLPDPSCYLLFLEAESRNINHLVLIFFRLAREAHAVVRTANTLGFCA